MIETQIGIRPGTIREQATSAQILLARYNAQDLNYSELAGFEDLPAISDGNVLWLDIIGVPGKQGLEAVHQAYGLHRLALEDVQNQGQLPKHENFDAHVFDVLQVHREGSGLDGDLGQLSLFQAPGLIISIHDQPGMFDPVRARLDGNRGIIRGAGAHYLLYALIDVAVDINYALTDHYETELLRLEERAEEHADLSRDIYALRRPLAGLMRQAQRQRDVVRQLIARDADEFNAEHEVFWRDCLDHADRFLDGIVQLRDSAGDLLNTHLAMVSHRMNDVMKVLTIMSTIFVPLSFLVGLYGMNFDTESPWNLPELGWKYGYLYVWGLMAVIVSGILVYFHRKRWF